MFGKPQGTLSLSWNFPQVYTANIATLRSASTSLSLSFDTVWDFDEMLLPYVDALVAENCLGTTYDGEIGNIDASFGCIYPYRNL